MGSTNKTTNYDLSQFVGSDKPSWLGDYNADMGKIDLAIKARAVEAGQAQASADTANGKADALDTRMDTAEDNILALQNASTTDHTQIATNTANISKNAQDIVQLDAKIGHTQITIGDHTVTGAIAELATRPAGGGDAEDVNYNNTTSGLTATNVQAAIDEVKADIPDDASEVAYSNTQSGLSATTVQGAIDELASSPQTGATVRYDETTDYLQCLVSGNWVNAIYLALKSLIVYLSGVFNYAMSKSSTLLLNSYSHVDLGVTINQNDITLQGNMMGSGGSSMNTLVTDATVAVSGKRIKVDYYLNSDSGNIQTASTGDVANADGYIYIAPYRSSGQCGIAFGANPSRSGTIGGNDARSTFNIETNDVVHVVKIYAE